MATYIEREAVLRAYIDLCTAKSKLAKTRKGAAFFQSDLLPETELTDKEWVRLINATPAADVAPVLHGRWEERERPTSHLVCSVCSRKNFMRVKSAYCPNCGADMRGE